MWTQVPLRLSLRPLLLESLWQRWAPSKIFQAKNCPLSFKESHFTMCVYLVLVCKTGEKKGIGKITLKRLQRVGTVMADQEVLDIANRRTVRKGFPGWPKQMFPTNCAREGLWKWIVEPDFTCALTSMIAFDLLPAPLLPCCARSSRQQRQLHCVFLLSIWDWEQAPSCTRYIVVAAGFKPRAKSPVHMSHNYLPRPSSLQLSHKLGQLHHFFPYASVLKTWACKGSRHHFNIPWCKIIK